MYKTFIMLGLICLLATFMIIDFILVIPKFGSKYFGAPDDIKAIVSRLPDRAVWINILGVFIMLVGFLGAIVVFVWAGIDVIKSGMNFREAFLRFFIVTEGYKLFDIICFDYLMLTKLKLPAKVYPETEGSKGYDNFGFNIKSQAIKLIIFCGISIALAFILTIKK